MRLLRLARSISLSILIALSLSSCHKDSPVGPGTTSEAATATIGPSGGTIGISDFSLTVPAGAFTTSNTITVSPMAASHPFGTNGISRLFGMKGIPLEFSGPLTLSIASTSRDSSIHFVALGKKVPFPGSDQEFMAFSFLPARDSAGRLTCTIPPRRNSAGTSSHIFRALAARDEEVLDIAIAIAGYDTTEQFNFVLYAPTFIGRNIKTGTLYALNYSAALLRNMGLPFPVLSTSNPIEAVAYRFEKDPNIVACYLTSDARSLIASDPWVSNSAIALNVEKLTQAESKQIIAQCGRELFLFVPEAIYSNQNYAKYTAPDKYWMHMAFGSWFEEKATQDPAHVPSGLAGNELQPLRGIVEGAGQTLSSSRQHGLGMAPVMKYLITRYNENLVWRVYEALRLGSDHVDALLSSMEELPSNWYPDFLQKYLSGEIYGVSAQKFLNSVQGTARIQAAKDTSFSYEVLYPDLSASLFLVDLAYPEIDEKASLRILLTPSEILGKNGTALVFGIEGGKLNFLAQGQDVTIAKLRDLTAAGQKILVAAVNSSSEKPYDVPLTATLRLKVVSSGYRYVYFKLLMAADYLVRNTRTQRDTLWRNKSLLINEEAVGNTSGTVYTADTVIVSTLAGATDTVRVRIELDEKNPTVIRKLTASRWGMRDTTRIGWSLWGHDLPVTTSAPGAFIAEVLGPSVGSHVDSVQYQNWELEGRLFVRLTQCWGADASEFRVALSEQPLIQKRTAK